MARKPTDARLDDAELEQVAGGAPATIPADDFLPFPLPPPVDHGIPLNVD